MPMVGILVPARLRAFGGMPMWAWSPIDAEPLELIRIELPGADVEITREERGFLLKELCFVSDSRSIREALEVAGTTRTVALDSQQRERLRAALASWDADFSLSEGITGLLAALNRLPTRWSGNASTAALD